jgi:glycerophosphoryl diester phosphodiesterase
MVGATAPPLGCHRERWLDLCRRPGDMPKLVGHRGALAVAPENTMASFERAWRDGVDLVELDVRLSADHQVVVLHDAAVDRTTDGSGLITRFTVAELKRLDAGAWFDARFAGERIPTLVEVLTWAKWRVGLLLELKFDPFGSHDPALVPAVLKDVSSTGVEDQVAFISYQTRALVQVKALAPDIPVGPMPPRDGILQFVARLSRRFPALVRAAPVRRILTRPLTYAVNWGCDVVGPNIDVTTQTLVDAAHAVGLPVSCGGLSWDYPAAIAMGLDTISANDPGLVRSRFLLQ